MSVASKRSPAADQVDVPAGPVKSPYRVSRVDQNAQIRHSLVAALEVFQSQVADPEREATSPMTVLSAAWGREMA